MEYAVANMLKRMFTDIGLLTVYYWITNYMNNMPLILKNFIYTYVYEKVQKAIH